MTHEDYNEFVSLVKRMRDAQKSADGIEELEFECREIEREVDEWLEKLNKYEKRN